MLINIQFELFCYLFLPLSRSPFHLSLKVLVHYRSTRRFSDLESVLPLFKAIILIKSHHFFLSMDIPHMIYLGEKKILANKYVFVLSKLILENCNLCCNFMVSHHRNQIFFLFKYILLGHIVR